MDKIVRTRYTVVDLGVALTRCQCNWCDKAATWSVCLDDKDGDPIFWHLCDTDMAAFAAHMARRGLNRELARVEQPGAR